jgi:tetratricopeptide (TPR) repeat protein
MRLPYNIRFVLLFILPAFVLTYFTVSFLAPDDFSDSNSEMEFWRNRKVYLRSSMVALEMLKEDNKNPHLHYHFFDNYCRLDLRNRGLISQNIEEYFGSLRKYYDSLAKSESQEIYAIGFYGHWRLRTYLRHESGTLEKFQEADSFHLQNPYLNELRGDIYRKYDIRKAIAYFEKEIALYPKNKFAKIKLFRSLYRVRDSDRMKELLEDEEISSETSLYYFIRSYYFEHDFNQWLKSIHSQNFVVNDPLVVMNAIFIFVVWLVFLFYINVFREIHIGIFIFCGLFAILTIPLVVALYDTYYFTREGNYEENILWSNFIVGLFEEATKMIIPLFIALFLAQRLNSPFSVLVLFSLTSLVFALFENMLYFGNYFDLSIISVRGVYSVTMHLCAGTVAGYGYVQHEFRAKSVLFIALTFGMAVCMHMMYDLIAGSYVYLLNVPFVIISVYIMVSLYNNILNNSPDFDHTKEERLNRSGIVLICGLSAVLLAEFISNSFRYGFQIGNTTFMESMLSYGWLILVYATPVSNFKLVKDKWSFIDLGGMKSFDNISLDVKEIEVTPVTKNPVAYRLKIIGTIRAKTEKKWFHCLQENTGEYYLVNYKEEGDHLIDHKILLHVLRGEKEVPHAFDPKSYDYLGMVFSSPVIE